MRARILRPGFFDNPDLSACGSDAMLLFAGLWCLADREGRLKDEPKRIRAHVFPYSTIESEPLLDLLTERGFIVRYTVGDEACIWIPCFHSHQQPHRREAASVVPPYPGEGQSQDMPRTDEGQSKAAGIRYTVYGISSSEKNAPADTSKSLPPCLSKATVHIVGQEPVSAEHYVWSALESVFGVMSDFDRAAFAGAIRDGCLTPCDGSKADVCALHLAYKIGKKGKRKPLLCKCFREDRGEVDDG